MVIFEAIQDFVKAIHEQEFLEDQKEVSTALNTALSQSYLDDSSEIDLVKRTILALNSTPGRKFKLESLFVHGNRSQVQFEYYGKTAKKELGDLIIVSTMTFRSKPVLQKMTIIQAKKDTMKMNSSWGIDPEQLYFLSTWPAFMGVKGIFPKIKNVIFDNSGCLGSYLLYRQPGDFVFIAAPILGRFLNGKKRVTIDELVQIHLPASLGSNMGSFSTQNHLLFPYMHPKEWYYIWEEYLYRSRKMRIPLPFNPFSTGLPFLGNQLLAINVNDTVHHLSLLNIGELIYSVSDYVSANEYAFRLLNTVLRYIRQQRRNELEDMNIFQYMPRDAPMLDNLDLQGISIGLIHTITEVGQG